MEQETIVKNIQDYLITTTPAEEQVKKYLIDNASEQLKEKIINSDKNIEDCLLYIANEVRNKAKSNCFVASDEEVYGLAIHYFEEDEIKKFSGNVQTKVTTNAAPAPKANEVKSKPKQTKPAVKPESKNNENKGYDQMSIFDL